MKGLAAAVFIACFWFDSGCIHYQPHALNPVQTERQLRALNLNSPGLAEFVRAQSGNASLSWPPAKLDPDTLTYIAYFFSPDVEVARAKAAVAAAAVLTVRQRINPSLTGDGGYNRTPDSIASYSASTAFTIETAGKRRFRILEAEKQREATRIAVYEAGWEVRNRMRGALLAAWAAAKRLEILEAEQKLRAEIHDIFEKRVELGESSNRELRAAEEELATLEVTLRSTRGEVLQNGAAIAAAAGIPAGALADLPIDFAPFESPATPDKLPLSGVQQAGLLHRADIRRTLAEYEAADAALRLALAGQYPNLSLGPSYFFQEGFPAYMLASAIDSLPVFHHNQGPVAQREANLSQIAAEFKALQSKVIGDTEIALRQYRAAVEEWTEVRNKLVPLERQREESVGAAFRAGDADRLEVTQSRLLTLAEDRAEFDALERAQKALGLLENAVESPLGAGLPAPRQEKAN